MHLFGGIGPVDCWLSHDGVAEARSVRLYETKLWEGGHASAERTQTRQGCKIAVASVANAVSSVPAHPGSRGSKATDDVPTVSALLRTALRASARGPVGFVRVDTSARAQTLEGFGGAFTEAAALTWIKLPPAEQALVIEAYFGESGLRYSMGRVHMNSCDFCVDSYDFAPVAGDYDLTHFDASVAHDREAMIPLMLAAKKALSAWGGGNLELFASPWSPPEWLKEPRGKLQVQSVLNSAEPNGLLRGDRAHKAWALYYSKFATAYKDAGLQLWGFTVQNEPEFSAPWEACRWNASATRDFVLDYLGPRLRADHKGMKIFAFDHNRDHVVDWARTLYDRPVDAAKYLDGVAFHWYAGSLNRKLDGAVAHFNSAPLLLPSEGCNCPGVIESGLMRAERYAHDMLSDLWHGSCGWIDWNLLLDHVGGPNHLGNKCDAPILAVDANFSAVKFQSYFDVIGQFSKHLPKGSVRLDVLGAGQGAYGPEIRALPSRAIVGFELTLFDCEGGGSYATPRQAWKFDGKSSVQGRMQLDDTTVTDEWAQLCISERNDPSHGSATLNNCQWAVENHGDAVGKFSLTDDGALQEVKTGKCLVAAPDQPSAQGVPVILGDCAHKDATRWAHTNAGEVRSADGRCLTAGWPFFMAVAFETPDRATAVVVVNEADVACDFAIEIDAAHIVQADVPAHTVQTYVIDPP
ncbi:O-glycosyl hydrolase family 30-domain-containing protein [Pelagophyceae sp. CCMP2097]|nr:O-glycosyl hydrolase family 30-domain-containing protein [Pelagophyceae sp. CCMP2097]